MNKGRMWAQALSQNTVRTLGCLHERVEASRGLWWSAGGQAQVRENFDDHRGVLDGREEGQRPAALWAGGEIDGEDAFE